MAINTHGFEMIGVKKIAGETKELKGSYSSIYLQLNYDMSTGELFTKEHNSIGHNAWTVYPDENIVVIGNLYKPCTMQEIADMVAEKLQNK